tara:strand:+ start:162 stop:785 length:624 start_codon:yes stop_codon:yes gene_type:complete
VPSKKVKVCILDYGSGNVKSVFNILTYLGYEAKISNSKSEINESSHIVLPGVGSFKASMEKIKKKISLDTLHKEIITFEKPFLGICVGMQVLMEKGFEDGENSGLGWFKGEVKKLEVEKSPLPHIGWNDIEIKSESLVLDGIKNLSSFYFVHSFAVDTNSSNILTTTTYENSFCSAIAKKNIFGVQFHPEKSQKAGQKLLKNFCSLL